MIKKYVQFLENKNNIPEYGCVMIVLPIEDWDEILSQIDPKDIFKPNTIDPHITLLYGLHDEVTNEDVENILNRYKGPISVDITGIDKFDNKDFSVVKLNVKCPLLHKINDELKTLTYTEKFPDYKPHITIAFTYPGEADKYLKGDYTSAITSNKIVYTKANGEKTDYYI